MKLTLRLPFYVTNPKFALIAVLLTFISMSFSSAQMRQRVKIQNGNVVADNGTPLRATPFFLDLFSVPDMQDNESLYREYFREVIDKYHFNAIRISPWIGPWDYDVKNNSHHNSTFTYMVDKVVDWCEEEGIYAIVNLHTQFETELELQKVKDFWDVMAPRYKDKTHVVFEAVNEPSTGSALSLMEDIYEYLRAKAQDTHIILWTTPNATRIKKSDLDAKSRINYSNASFGFHVYDFIADKRAEWDHAKSIRDAGYPVICTEFFSLTNANDMPIAWNFLMGNIDIAEDYNMSWMNWGPFANYRFTNKSDWTHSAIGFSQRFLDELDSQGVPHWSADGTSGGGTPSTSGTFYIKNKSIGLYLRPDFNGENSSLYLSGNDNSNWFKWEKVNTNNGYFYLKNVQTGKYFRPASSSDGARMQLKSTGNTNNWTQWKEVTSADGNTFHFANRQTGKYIRPINGSNTNVEQRPNTWSGDWTRWSYETAGGSSGGGDATVVVNARGVAGSEQFELLFNDARVGNVTTLSTSDKSYVFTLPKATGNIKVKFFNDAPGRDMRVDWIQINGGTVIQAEAQPINTGSWNSAENRCGGVPGEWIYCGGGYIDFGNRNLSQQSQAAFGGLPQQESGSEEAYKYPQNLLIYPNPVKVGDMLTINNASGDYTVQIFDARGVMVFTKSAMNGVEVIDLRGMKKGIYSLIITDLITQPQYKKIVLE